MSTFRLGESKKSPKISFNLSYEQNKFNKKSLCAKFFFQRRFPQKRSQTGLPNFTAKFQTLSDVLSKKSDIFLKEPNITGH